MRDTGPVIPGDGERAPLMPFGRYAGQPLDAIPTAYLRWLVKTMPQAPIAAWVRGELFMRGVDQSDDA